MLRDAAAAGSEPGADRRRALRRWVERLDEFRALALEPDQRPLAGQGAGNDHAIGGDAVPMRVERDDRKLPRAAQPLRARDEEFARPGAAEDRRRYQAEHRPALCFDRGAHGVACAIERRFARDPALDEIGRSELELRLDQADEPRPLMGELKHSAAAPAVAI